MVQGSTNIQLREVHMVPRNFTWKMIVMMGSTTWWQREVQHGDGGKYDMVPLFFSFLYIFS
jgi:hypothetical protein